jgi:hypothetical protein
MARRTTVLLLVLVAGCSAACSSGGSASPSTTVPAGTVAPRPAAATTTPPVGTRCRNGQLAVAIQHSFVGAGSAAEELGFHNVSRSACTLDGYPVVAALDSMGDQIAQAVRGDLDGGPPTDVDLEPGHWAGALVQGSDGSSRECASFTRTFLVTPPDLTRSAVVRAAATSAAIGVSGSCQLGIDPVALETAQPLTSG